jgi:hypothetical protein
MANTRITSSFITREFLSVLHSNLRVVKSIDHSWNKLFGKSIGAVGKSGATVAIRKPALGTIRTGWPMNQSDITETSVNLTIDTPVGVDLNFSDADMALSIEDFSERYIVPNAMKLASYVDMSVANFVYKNTFNSVNSTAFGTAPNASSYFLSAGQKIKENLVPMDSPLNAIISPRTEAAMVGALAGQYNPQGNISDMYEKGQMAKALGMDWYMSQVLPAHTHGTMTTGTSPAVSAWSGSTLTITNCTNGGTLNAGDVFTVSTCYAVNRETGQTYPSLQQFVCTATTTASTTTLTVSVSPTPVTSGPSQTVSATPVGGTAVFNQTTSGQIAQQDLVLHEKSFAIAFANLELPNGMDMVGQEAMDGINCRFIRGYDIANARFLSRMDVFYGVCATRPEWACRLQS